MTDRQPLHPGRVKLVPVAGQENVYDLVRADEALVPGTELKKATLLSDETERFIWGDTQDRTVDQALYTAKKNTNHVFEVGDIRVTARTDLGDDWLLCNGEIITDDYPELKERIYPTRYGWYDGDREEITSTGQYLHAYYGGKYWRVHMDVEGEDDDAETAVIELYSAEHLWDEWKLEWRYTDTTGYSIYGSFTEEVIFSNGTLYCKFYPWQSSGLRCYIITIPLDNISAAGVATYDDGSVTTGMAYNDVTGKWYFGGAATIDDDERFYLYESDTYVIDTAAATRYVLGSNYTYNSSYSNGFRPLYCKNGIVYGSFYNRKGSYAIAFTDPGNPAITGNNGAATDIFYDAYYSDILDTVVAFSSYEETTSGGSTGAFVYTYDRTANTWVRQGDEARSHKINDIFELNGLFYVDVSGGITVYEDIRDVNTIISLYTGATNGSANDSAMSTVPLALRSSPVLLYVASVNSKYNSRYGYFTPHLRTITVDNAYVYIRGRVTE